MNTPRGGIPSPLELRAMACKRKATRKSTRRTAKKRTTTKKRRTSKKKR